MYLVVQQAGESWAVISGVDDLPAGALYGRFSGADASGFGFSLQTFLNGSSYLLSGTAMATDAGNMTLSGSTVSGQFQLMQRSEDIAAPSDLPAGNYVLYLTRDDNQGGMHHLTIRQDGSMVPTYPAADDCGIRGEVHPSSNGSKLFWWTLSNSAPAGTDCRALAGGELLQGFFSVHQQPQMLPWGLGLGHTGAHTLAVRLAPP